MARKDLAEMKRASGFQVDFWTAFTNSVIDLGGTADYLFGANQEQLKAAAIAAAQTLVPQPEPVSIDAGLVVARLELSVDHTKTVEELVTAGNYTYANTNITAANFPHQREGIEAVTLNLVKFDKVGTTADRERILAAHGDPSDMDDMLCVGVQYPDQQRKYPIVFLGASWVYPSGDRCVGCLYGDAESRSCFLDWTNPDNHWNPLYVFAVRARQ